MSRVSSLGWEQYRELSVVPFGVKPPVELLMFAIPHHQERLRPTEDSSN